MAVDWGLYARLLGSDDAGGTREQTIQSSVDSYAEGLTEDPAYQKDAVVNGVTTPIAVTRTSTIKCGIKALPGTGLHIGDIVQCLGETWIVTELYVDKIGIIDGVMWMCNGTIRFQNNNPTIYVRPCVIDDGSYSKRTSTQAVFAESNTYTLYVSIDAQTERLYVDKRLAFGTIYNRFGEKILETYKIGDIDHRSQNYGAGSHLMLVGVQRDVYNPQTDDIDLLICDVFKESDADVTTETPIGQCSILGSETIRIGTKRRFRAELVNSLGEAFETEAVWNVTAPYGIEYLPDNNECEISVPLQYDLIGSTILIELRDVNNELGAATKSVGVIAVG